MSDPINIVVSGKKDRYEYCQADCLPSSVFEQCNRLGKERWLLCATIPSSIAGQVCLVFARTILPKKSH